MSRAPMAYYIQARTRGRLALIGLAIKCRIYAHREALILIGAFLLIALADTVADLFAAAMAFLFN